MQSTKRQGSSPEERLEKIRKDREKNHQNQETCEKRLKSLKEADSKLEREESLIFMQIIHRNAVQKFGENYDTNQLLEYLNSLAGEKDQEPCATPAQGEAVAAENQNHSLPEEPYAVPAQGQKEVDT